MLTPHVPSYFYKNHFSTVCVARLKNMDIELGHIFSQHKTSNKMCSEG